MFSWKTKVEDIQILQCLSLRPYQCAGHTGASNDGQLSNAVMNMLCYVLKH